MEWCSVHGYACDGDHCNCGGASTGATRRRFGGGGVSPAMFMAAAPAPAITAPMMSRDSGARAIRLAPGTSGRVTLPAGSPWSGIRVTDGGAGTIVARIFARTIMVYSPVVGYDPKFPVGRISIRGDGVDVFPDKAKLAANYHIPEDVWSQDITVDLTTGKGGLIHVERIL